MTTEEIQHYVNETVRSNFEDYTADSMEMMTSEGGDGRFFGKVTAVRYGGLSEVPEIYLAIGKTERGVQIVKFGLSECLNPEKEELDFLMKKELGIECGEK